MPTPYPQQIRCGTSRHQGEGVRATLLSPDRQGGGFARLSTTVQPRLREIAGAEAAVEFVGMIGVCAASFATIAGSTYKPFIYFRF